MMINTFNETRRATDMFESCVKTGSYGLRECAHAVNSILDIGANVGFFSVVARILCPEAKVVSMEPDQETFLQLLANCKHLRIQPINYAFGPGVPIRNFSQDQPERKTYGTRFDIGGNGDMESPSIGLRKVLESFSLHDGLFIKIDCEGAERYLVGDPESENIIKRCVGIGGEFHSVSELSIFQYEEWIRSLISDTHSIRFHRRVRNRVVEFRAVRKKLNPTNRLRALPKRKVCFSRRVKILKRKQRCDLGQVEEFDHDFASHMVCCGYGYYVL